MNIELLIKILSSLGGEATLDAICDVYRRLWNMYIDASFKSAVNQILSSNPNVVRYNRFKKQWELGTFDDRGHGYLYVSNPKTFKRIDDVMRQVFGVQHVQPQHAFFKFQDKAVWFPKFDAEKWQNTLSDDGTHWYERPVDGHRTGIDDRQRYVFEFGKFGTRGKVYKFTGLFKQTEAREDGTRVYEIVDDKVPILGHEVDTSSLRKMLVCNITYMKYYDGITEFDPITGGGGSYPTDNNDCGEKFNFKVCPDGKVRGFVETGSVASENGTKQPKNIAIEGIGDAFKSMDEAAGVRVVFISKGLRNDKNVVVGWYDNAKVFRKRQTSEGQYGYCMECAKEDAHLIPEASRTFKYPKINEDGTANFGQSNLSYPRFFKQDSTFALVNRLNDYLDWILAEQPRLFFGPVVVPTWNYFEKKGKPGDVERFSATADMMVGDYLVIYVGKDGNDGEPGVYALSKIISAPAPYVDEDAGEDYGKLYVGAEYIVASDDCLISYDDTLRITHQVRSTHLIDSQYYGEILKAFGLGEGDA